MVGGVKAYYIALLAFSFCLPALGAKKKTGVEEAGYKGRVKSVREFSHKIEEKFGKPVRSQGGLQRTYKYDEKGNQTELVDYDASGEIFHKYIYKYDEKGNKTEEVVYDASGKVDGKILGKYTYKFDKRGNKISEIEYVSKTAFGKTRLVPIEETTYEYTFWD